MKNAVSGRISDDGSKFCYHEANLLKIRHVMATSPVEVPIPNELAGQQSNRNNLFSTCEFRVLGGQVAKNWFACSKFVAVIRKGH